MLSLNVVPPFFPLLFIYFFLHELVQHSSQSPSWKSHQVALDRGTEGYPGRPWAAGRAARPYAWPAPSGLD